MKRTILRSAAVLGTVGFASLLLVACGGKKDDTSASENELTVYVDNGYKAYMEEAAKAFEKESGTKVTIKTGDAQRQCGYPSFLVWDKSITNRKQKDTSSLV